MRIHPILPFCLALVALAAACSSSRAGSSSTSGSGGSTAASTPPASEPPASTGSYVPAAGTDKSGAIFQTYSDPKLHYHLRYPGGWNISHAKGLVRIAKLGNVIVIASRTSKFPPKVKGVRAAIEKQRKADKIIAIPLPPRTVKLGNHDAIKMVFTKQRPASATAPEATLVVYRYLLYHDGHIVILSLQSPDTVDNKLAYGVVADSFGF